MASWSSNPSVPHTGGTFDFPTNTSSSDKQYTITYTDNNGCTGQTTYTVTPSCSCSKLSLNSGSHTFAATGQTITAATVSSPCSVSNFTVTNLPSWVSSGTNGNSITLTASNNTGEAKGPNTINFVRDGSETCTSMTVSQEASAPTCDCDKVNITATTINPNFSSGETQVGVITDSSCASNVTYVSTEPSWLSGITKDGNNVRIVYSENTSSNNRSGQVHVQMNGSTCKTINVNQSGKVVCNDKERVVQVIYNLSPSLAAFPSDFTADFEVGFKLHEPYICFESSDRVIGGAVGVYAVNGGSKFNLYYEENTKTVTPPYSDRYAVNATYGTDQISEEEEEPTYIDQLCPSRIDVLWNNTTYRMVKDSYSATYAEYVPESTAPLSTIEIYFSATRNGYYFTINIST